MNKRKLLCLLLCLVMVASLVLPGTWAMETGEVTHTLETCLEDCEGCDCTCHTPAPMPSPSGEGGTANAVTDEGNPAPETNNAPTEGTTANTPADGTPMPSPSGEGGTPNGVTDEGNQAPETNNTPADGATANTPAEGTIMPSPSGEGGTPNGVTDEGKTAPSDPTVETEVPAETTEAPTTEPTEETEAPTTEPTFEDTTIIATAADGTSFEVSGKLPVGAALSVVPADDGVSEYIRGNILNLDELPEGYTDAAYDISILVDGEKYQPTEQVTVKVKGTDTTTESDVDVYHLPDTSLDDIYRIIQSAYGITTMSLETEPQKTLEDIHPETLSANPGEGYITFNTDGFSTYYIVSGSQSDQSGNDTFYILRGTSVELTRVTDSDYTVTFSGDSDEDSGAVLEHSNSTLTFSATSGTAYGVYTIKISSSRIATIHVLSAEDMFKLPGIVNDVYFTVISDSTEIPSEPMSGGSYSWNYIKKSSSGYTFNTNQWGTNGRYQDTPHGFLDLNAIASSDALAQNLRGQNVIGIVDRGLGNDTRPGIQLTNDQWNAIMLQFVSSKTVYINDGNEQRVRLTADMINQNPGRYKMYPYVIKLIIDDNGGQDGWHVDCCIVDTLNYYVAYEYNLPSTAIIQNQNLYKPETLYYTPNTTGVNVGIMKYGNQNVNVNSSVTIYDTDTFTTEKYKFLEWNTSPDGSGTSYLPNDTLPPITENVTLYAIWDHTVVSGSLKISKNVVFEDENDERKQESLSNTEYTFNVTLPSGTTNATYTIYSGSTVSGEADVPFPANNQITLKHGQYAVINNVSAGEATVTESVATDAQFKPYYKVGTASTETAGNSANITVEASKQAAIEFINKYEALTGSLSITKLVSKEYENDVLPNDSFTFQVDFAGVNTGRSFTYTIKNADGTDGNGGNIADNGEITLTAGQTVTFPAAPKGAFTVTETGTNLNEYTTTYKIGSGDATESTVASGTVPSGSSETVTFENTYKRHKADLIIEKVLSGNAYDENDSFIFDVKEGSTTVATVAIKGAGSVTIKDLEIGKTYTVTERSHNRYTSTGGGAVTIKESGNKVTVTNTLNIDEWLSSTDYKHNVFNGKN